MDRVRENGVEKERYTECSQNESVLSEKETEGEGGRFISSFSPHVYPVESKLIATLFDARCCLTLLHRSVTATSERREKESDIPEPVLLHFPEILPIPERRSALRFLSSAPLRFACTALSQSEG